MIGHVGNRTGRGVGVPGSDEVVDDAEIADHHQQRRCEPHCTDHEQIGLMASQRCRPEQDAEDRCGHERCGCPGEVSGGVAADVVARGDEQVLCDQGRCDERRYRPQDANDMGQAEPGCRR